MSEKKTDGLAIRKELNPLCAGSAERLCGAISIIVITIWSSELPVILIFSLFLVRSEFAQTCYNVREKKQTVWPLKKELNPLCAGSAERLCGAISIIVITISA